MAKNKTWKIIYPNGEESIMNYNPIEEERENTIKEMLNELKKFSRYKQVNKRYGFMFSYEEYVSFRKKFLNVKEREQ